MAWLQRVALLLQRSSTAPSLRRAGLGTNLNAPPANTLFEYGSITAFLRASPQHRCFSVAPSLDDEDDNGNAGYWATFNGVRGSEAVQPSPEAFARYRTEVEQLFKHKELPRKGLLFDFIDSSCEEDHIDEILDVLKRLKIERALRRQSFSPLYPAVSTAFALACVRAEAPKRGLVALQRRNPYGLKPGIDPGNVLISKAGDDNDIDLVLKIFRTLLLNGIHPRPNTASLVLKAISKEKEEHTDKFFRISEEFYINGILLWPTWYEKLMTRAMTLGDFDLFRKWAQRREKGALPLSKRVGFIMAKGYILAGQPKKAAEVLTRAREYYAKDLKRGQSRGAEEGWDRASKDLVTDWPTFLGNWHRWPHTKVNLEKLKASLLQVEALLKEQGTRFEVDVAAEFEKSGPKEPLDEAVENAPSEASGTEDETASSEAGGTKEEAATAGDTETEVGGSNDALEVVAKVPESDDEKVVKKAEAGLTDVEEGKKD